jgi:hypothetical protein
MAATARQLLLENASLLYGASRTTSVIGAILLILAGCINSRRSEAFASRIAALRSDF